MKKLFTAIMLIMLTITLAACSHSHKWGDASCISPPICKGCGAVQEGATSLGHDWREASCTAPKTCARCNLTEGITLQHTFADATCEQPKTCTVCGLADGAALGHDLHEGKTSKAPTCSENGIEEATCARCSKSISQEIDRIEHTAGAWEIKTYPSTLSDGVRVQKCSMCGSVIKEEKYSLTMGQKNALREAESYLNFMAFSRKGLIDQLEFEGYSKEDATFAVDNVNVDWNEQCYKDAQSYLDFMSFSKSGLKSQLKFEGYTDEQIDYAIRKIGY